MGKRWDLGGRTKRRKNMNHLKREGYLITPLGLDIQYLLLDNYVKFEPYPSTMAIYYWR